MDHKTKALEAVRRVCPELMRLNKGCRFELCNEEMEQVEYEVAWIGGTEDILTGKSGFSMYAFTVGIGKNNDPYPKWHSFDNPEDYEEDGMTFFDYATIIGHTPHLSHWLRLLKKKCIYRISVSTFTDTEARIKNDHKKEEVCRYDLTKDDQDESFYKAICELCSL